MSEPSFTIGHSNRTLAEFIELLQESHVELVVDVRRLPGSARYPQFDQDTLSVVLGEAGIRYRRAEGLTGRRPVSKDVPFEVNAWWENRSFHNYADHALSDGFRSTLAELREWGRTRRSAVMCSEAVWWRCHRRIIADHLLARDEDVRHILGPGHIDAAQLSPGAFTDPHGNVTYPATG
ncbi:DUF488 family protein [Nocardiopsis sp. NPDC058631]|uniref:DUF488 domain-containing protein n=1 Tax=Nocardiopsis sp. NPDC058631 TaxID=3346566 RepID=UPI003658CA26